MLKLEDIKAGDRLTGVIPGATVDAVATTSHGPDSLQLVYKKPDGGLGELILNRDSEASLARATQAHRPFTAPGDEFKLAAEAQRIKLAGLFDPMLAVSTSDIRPLPHQLRAVYGELLPRRPLRFLLADDPGAGKTIMAGLYMKELILRDDVKRCLIVAPGGLVDQWQDELYLKFGLKFHIFSRQMTDSPFSGSVFDEHPLLIARMDQLSRNEELLEELQQSHWDLIVVDEAHRMGAHYYGHEVKKTKRFLLGETLGDVARHLLLMTATPHAGKEDDFQLFLTLLDRDRFEGKHQAGVHKTDTSGVMRRMIKEDLLTFEGKPLFPERIAETVPYKLTAAEQALYEAVTDYVREGMNRADKLSGKRKNTVGFALTVLQRRLASSPEAIYQSLIRRTERLKRKRDEIENGTYVEDSIKHALPIDDEFDDEDYSAEELESAEEELLDAATAARTVEELDIELKELAALTDQARDVRNEGTDRKWSELSRIIQDDTLKHGKTGAPRKLIVFTEHKDTLEYLSKRIRTLLGKHQAVETIHGGVPRAERRRITEEFTGNPECQILLATDAAGEGLNLQAAHLMVNYDLPWNPNRIEQRFGRIHRIGQTEVCRLWNLVAEDTREGEVFLRLLLKIEEQRKAYGGKVFDVLGAAFTERPLRDLLMEAIRYGELPETRAKMEEQIDAGVSEGIRELLKDQALAAGKLADSDIDELRAAIDDARARRLQPHYIERAFREGFGRLGGRMSQREKGKFEITRVPAQVMQNQRARPVSSKYERVTFDLDLVGGPDQTQLLAPGHPLHDEVVDQVISKFEKALIDGSVLVSGTIEGPRLLVGAIETISDATDTAVSQRFGYVYVDENGDVTPAGPAPYLDCVPAPDSPATANARSLPWAATGEDAARSWIIANRLSGFLDEIKARRGRELERVRAQVVDRLEKEADRLIVESMAVKEKEDAGQKVRESSGALVVRASDIDVRLKKRLELLDRQEQMSPLAPRVATAALVIPATWLEEGHEEQPVKPPTDTKAVERRGVDLVLKTEQALGRIPTEQAFNNPGFDVLSQAPGEDPIRIEVKARIEGADEFFITNTEAMTALNAAPRYRLALVRVDTRGPEYDEVRYLDKPFTSYDLGGFAATGIRGDWNKMWDTGKEPF